MDIEVNAEDVVPVLRQRFPKELEICIQAVQIQKLLDKCNCEDSEDDTEVS